MAAAQKTASDPERNDSPCMSESCTTGRTQRNFMLTSVHRDVDVPRAGQADDSVGQCIGQDGKRDWRENEAVDCGRGLLSV